MRGGSTGFSTTSQPHVELTGGLRRVFPRVLSQGLRRLACAMLSPPRIGRSTLVSLPKSPLVGAVARSVDVPAPVNKSVYRMNFGRVARYRELCGRVSTGGSGPLSVGATAGAAVPGAVIETRSSFGVPTEAEAPGSLGGIGGAEGRRSGTSGASSAAAGLGAGGMTGGGSDTKPRSGSGSGSGSRSSSRPCGKRNDGIDSSLRRGFGGGTERARVALTCGAAALAGTAARDLSGGANARAGGVPSAIAPGSRTREARLKPAAAGRASSVSDMRCVALIRLALRLRALAAGHHHPQSSSLKWKGGPEGGAPGYDTNYTYYCNSCDN